MKPSSWVASNLSQLVQNLPSTSYDQTIDLGHNDAGQITSRAGSNASYEWSPSAPATTSYTPNGLNQYSAVGGSSFTYDARGNLTSDGAHSFFTERNAVTARFRLTVWRKTSLSNAERTVSYTVKCNRRPSRAADCS